jgi:hypothetical protein
MEDKMRYLMILMVSFLTTGAVYAQDSTQVSPITPPPEMSTSISPDTAPNNIWLDNHNKDLLKILDTLVIVQLDRQRARVLISKFSQQGINLQETADFRTKAISEFLGSLINEYKKRAPR